MGNRLPHYYLIIILVFIIKKNRKRKKKDDNFSIFKVFSRPFNSRKNPENESDDESILSISIDISDERNDDKKNVIKSKKLSGPNTHNNSRFGLPSDVNTPPLKSDDDEKQDYDFHARIIGDNIKYYKKHKIRKEKRDKNKIKSASLNGVDNVNDVFSDIDD